MPFLYTASKMMSKYGAPSEFSIRKIEGMTTGDLSRLEFIGVPGGKQVAYDNYVTNLPAFLFATDVGKKVYVATMWFDLRLESSKFIPVKYPDLVVSSPKPLKTEMDKVAFQASLGYPSDSLRGPSGEQFLIRNITPEVMRGMPRGLPDFTPSPPEATSARGMKSYFKTVRLLTLFLSTHTYPAYQSPDDMEGLLQTASDAPFIRAQSARGLSNNYRGIPLVPDGNMDVDSDVAITVGGSAAWITSDAKLSLYHPEETCIMAKPAPFRPLINVVSPAEIPNLPGYILPYFRGLTRPDKFSIRRIVRRFFLGSFGSTRDSCMSSFEEWWTGVDKWYQTDAGREICHIFFCIEIALEAQARVLVMKSSEGYVGCAIVGYRFTIWREGKSVSPDTPSELRALAATLDRHSIAVERIRSILSGLALRDVSDDEEEVDVSSARAIHREVNRRTRPSEEDANALEEAVSHLTFEKPAYWSLTLDKIVEWIRIINEEDTSITDLPMFLTAKNLHDTSIYCLATSAFGPMAPSLIDASGEVFDIPKGVTADDPASERSKSSDKRSLEFIVVSGKKLEAAIDDARAVWSRRYIRQNQKERAAGFRTVKFTGGGRTQLWDELKKMPFHVEPVLGKRQRSATPGASTSKKRATSAGPKDVLDPDDF